MSEMEKNSCGRQSLHADPCSVRPLRKPRDLGRHQPGLWRQLRCTGSELQINMNSLLQAGFWSKPNQFCYRRILLQSPGFVPLMYWFDTILEFHDGIRNVRSRYILDKLSVVCIHVMVQKLVVDEVCQIFGVDVKFLRSQCRSLWHTAVDCARARIVDLRPIVGLCSIAEIWPKPLQSRILHTESICAAPVTWLDDLQCRKRHWDRRSSSTRAHNLPLSIVLTILLWTAKTAVSVEWNER